jgi:hypothetical protein
MAIERLTHQPPGRRANCGAPWTRKREQSDAWRMGPCDALALVCGRHGRIPNLVFVLRLAVDCRRVARSCRDLYRAAWARAKRADGWGPPSCLRKLGSAALQGRRCEGCFPRARHRPRGYSAAVFCCGGVFGVVTVVHQTLPPLKQVQEPPRHLRNRLIAVIGQVLGVRCNDVGTSVG